jgi:hypothetical protein
MAKKPEPGDQSGMGLSLDDILRLGRTRELNFVAALGKEGAVLVADLRKSGTALFNMARDRHDGISRAKSATGRLSVSGKQMTLSLEDDEIPGALTKQLRKMLTEAGAPMKVVFRLPGGGTDEEDAEDPARDGAANDSMDRLRAGLSAEYDQMQQDIRAVIDATPRGAGQKAAQLVQAFQTALAGPDPSKAMPVLKLLTTFVAGERLKLAKAAGGAQGGRIWGNRRENPFATRPGGTDPADT